MSLRGILLFFLASTQWGCSTISYLYQAGKGQLAISSRARPLDDVIADFRTPENIRTLLKEVPKIKAYGELQGLEPTPNYEQYVKWDHEALLWVVTGCQPFKFEARRWGFPLVGSFTYLGFFDEGKARDFSAELAKEGWDVDVRPSGAFSSLGWFKDPIISTMIADGSRGTGSLVNVVLHESVHASLYIASQSYFNESVASFAADRMTTEYISRYYGKNSEVFLSYADNEKKWLARGEKFRNAYQRLEKLYAGNGSENDKLQEKNRILTSLKEEVKFNRPITNATLLGYRTYRTGEREFEDLWTACGKDWNRFWASLQKDLVEREGAFQQEQMEEFGPVVKGVKCR